MSDAVSSHDDDATPIASEAPPPPRLAARARDAWSVIRKRWLEITVFVAVISLFLLGRTAFITADPPPDLPNGYDSYELFAEPMAKAHEARNRALFDTWQTNPVDNYQYWRAQSPAWVYPLWLWFEVSGVTYASLRSFSAFAAAAGLLVMLIFCRHRMSLWSSAVAGAFVAFNFYAILYQRSGLLEVAVSSWLALLALALYRAKGNIAWLYVAPWALALGFLTKQTMITALPMFAVFGVPIYVRWVRHAKAPLWVKPLPLVHALAVAAALAWYCSRDAYMRTVKRNFNHVVHDTGSSKEHSVTLDLLKDRLFDTDQWYDGFVSLMPLVAGLALLQVVRLVLDLVTRGGARVLRRPVPAPLDDGWTLVATAWLFTAASSFLTAQTELRFRILLFLPAAVLAAAVVADAEKAARTLLVRYRPRVAFIAPAIGVGALVLALRADAGYYRDWVANRTYVVQKGNALVRKQIGRRKAVVLGSMAPWFAFETRYDFFYVRSEFNSKRKSLQQLGVTHVILLGSRRSKLRPRADFSKGILNRAFPGMMKKLQAKGSFDFRDRKITLYAVKKPPLR